MIELIKEYGEPLTHQKIVPGNTATAINAATYEIKGDRKIAYTGAGTVVMAVGNTITGATSAATAIIAARTIETGTDGAGTAAGVLYLTNQTGTFEAENLNIGTDLNVATIAEDSAKVSKGLSAKAMLVTVESYSANITIDGTVPTQTGGTNRGHALIVGTMYMIENPNAVRAFKCIDATASSASTVKITCFF